LNDEQIADIKMWFARPGTNRQELAKLYGISRSTLYRLVEGEDKSFKNSESQM